MVKFSIINIEMPSADTEYWWQLPRNCKWFTLQVRDGTAIRIATLADKVAKSNPPYFTLKANATWSEDDLDITSEDIFLYFACGSTGKVIEIFVGLKEEEEIIKRGR